MSTVGEGEDGGSDSIVGDDVPCSERKYGVPEVNTCEEEDLLEVTNLKEEEIGSPDVNIKRRSPFGESRGPIQLRTNYENNLRHEEETSRLTLS